MKQNNKDCEVENYLESTRKQLIEILDKIGKEYE